MPLIFLLQNFGKKLSCIIWTDILEFVEAKFNLNLKFLSVSTK